ncbi:conserved hypothetical protein [Burkholderiales bacterium 8X]|nr:conserved hypothetical protein [Burkholderiales bacterium 8X]
MPSTTYSRHLLIPFASHGSPACRQARAGLRLPNLDALLARLAATQGDRQDDSTLSPPHERALATALGIEPKDGLVPWAALEARRLGLPDASADEGWALATLCHWQVGIDDVVLADPAAIRIDAHESEALLAVARPFFEGDGIALHATDAPGRWLARAAVFADLPTASIDRAVGRPIAEWSPLSAGAGSLRRLQNEMQMLLYTERINDERTSRGVPAINSFWLSGTGRLAASFGPSRPAGPAVIDTLRKPALIDDGPGWEQAWREIDDGPLAELLAASKDAQGELSLTLGGDLGWQRFEWQKRGLLAWTRGLFQRTGSAQVLETL